MNIKEKGLLAGILMDLIVDDFDVLPKTKVWNKKSALTAVESIKKDALNCFFSSDRNKRAEKLAEIAAKVKDDEVRTAAVEALAEIRDSSIYSSDRDRINELILKLVIE